MRQEIQAYADEDDKPVLNWLLDNYRWSSQWQFVARCTFVGKNMNARRKWAPTREGRILYAAREGVAQADVVHVIGLGYVDKAAASDLLEALEDILPRYNSLHEQWVKENPGGAIIGGEYTMEKARAAIEKARARTNEPQDAGGEVNGEPAGSHEGHPGSLGQGGGAVNECRIKHTTRPWRLQNKDGFEIVIDGPVFYQGTPNEIRSVVPIAHIVRFYEGSDLEVEANAHLMLAAPDMLDALEGLVEHTENWTSGPAIMRARLAIEKARARTNV